jgi:hypothetical protein
MAAEQILWAVYTIPTIGNQFLYDNSQYCAIFRSATATETFTASQTFTQPTQPGGGGGRGIPKTTPHIPRAIGTATATGCGALLIGAILGLILKRHVLPDPDNFMRMEMHLE